MSSSISPRKNCLIVTGAWSTLMLRRSDPVPLRSRSRRCRSCEVMREWTASAAGFSRPVPGGRPSRVN
ncbi:MAG: hypothetical protein P8Z40_08280 [Chloroflexota bacterium]